MPELRIYLRRNEMQKTEDCSINLSKTGQTFRVLKLKRYHLKRKCCLKSAALKSVLCDLPDLRVWQSANLCSLPSPSLTPHWFAMPLFDIHFICKWECKHVGLFQSVVYSGAAWMRKQPLKQVNYWWRASVYKHSLKVKPVYYQYEDL